MFESLLSAPANQVLANTDKIIVQDRQVTLKLLVHLTVIEKRKLFLECGYSSMFDYCTKHLRLSEPGAWRRMRTARCLYRYPQLYKMLESGDINVTTVSIIARVLRPQNGERLIEQIRGKSKRLVQRIAAEYEPRMTLPPDRIRPVVVPVRPTDASSYAKSFRHR